MPALALGYVGSGAEEVPEFASEQAAPAFMLASGREPRQLSVGRDLVEAERERRISDEEGTGSRTPHDRRGRDRTAPDPEDPTPDPGEPTPPPPPALPEGSVVVAPQGSPSAPGTLEEPLDLATALGPGSPVQPGGAVLLRGGIYHGTFVSEIAGTPAAPIEVRSLPGEWAVLDGGRAFDSTLVINGDDTRFVSVEVTKSDPERRADTTDSAPPNFGRAHANGVDVYGERTRLLDMVVRDHRHGIGLWRSAIDAEVRGAIVFNNGFVNPDRGRGHGIYVQNLEGTKTIADSVIFNNFGYGIHGYSLSGFVIGLVVEGVTSFENGAPADTRYPNLFAGTSLYPVHQVTFDSNVAYHRPGVLGRNLQVGFGHNPNWSAEVTNNTVVGGSRVFTALNFEDLEVGGNSVHTERNSSETRFLVDLRGLTDVDTGYTWDHNSYYDRSATGATGPFTSFLINGISRRTFGDWRQVFGLDAQSSYTTERPLETEVTVRSTGSGSSIITVLNWPKETSVEIDLTDAGLAPGTAFEIRDVESYFGEPVATGVWNGGTVEIPLDSNEVIQPYGSGYHPVEPTPLEFGSYVLLTR